jgi:hypothetical protein
MRIAVLQGFERQAKVPFREALSGWLYSRE